VKRIDLRSHRYMREDVRLGWSFLVSAAALAGVEAPLARSFLYDRTDRRFATPISWPAGRTLASLGSRVTEPAKYLQQLLRGGF
jgi:opine dehydrogenase